ncbi:MAG: ribonuclease HII [Defluviimonas sp.]|uniref:ribonuclease HII n=1 Tax=Albidovulum sp. TaxID=1872424 RepID=UPI001D68391A|nr:ribonuclease HII [Paracoccaceae bacterium]MCC0063534.1 ribonuclease HII [Defluviimonas sp.]
MTDRPNDSFETAARARGYRCVAGVDEVGRGPLCGPVVAAAVHVPDLGSLPAGVNDSKKLRPDARQALCAQIRRIAVVGIGEASVEEIDGINILAASQLAMSRAVAALPLVPDHLLIDGNRLPADLADRAEAVVKGDERSLSIAAASIVAKVWRDRIMVDLAQQYPGYGWERNAGYPTKDHLAALQNLGVTPHHRRSFRPVHHILYQAEIVNP